MSLFYVFVVCIQVVFFYFLWYIFSSNLLLTLLCLYQQEFMKAKDYNIYNIYIDIQANEPSSDQWTFGPTNHRRTNEPSGPLNFRTTEHSDYRYAGEDYLWKFKTVVNGLWCHFGRTLNVSGLANFPFFAGKNWLINFVWISW